MTIFTKANIEWAIGQWSRLYGPRLSRYAALLILAAVAVVSDAVQLIIAGLFLAFDVRVPIPEIPSWVAVMFVTAAVVLLVVDRLAPLAAAAGSANDANLFNRLSAFIDVNAYNFLSYQEFRSSFFRNRLAAFDKLYYAITDGSSEFVDTEMEAALVNLTEKLAIFLNEISLKTYVHETNQEMQTVYGRPEDRDEPPPHTIEHIKAISDAGSDLLGAITEFRRMGRRKYVLTA